MGQGQYVTKQFKHLDVRVEQEFRALYSYLNTQLPRQVFLPYNLPRGPRADLLIGQGNSTTRYKPMSGQATIDADGVVSIANAINGNSTLLDVTSTTALDTDYTTSNKARWICAIYAYHPTSTSDATVALEINTGSSTTIGPVGITAVSGLPGALYVAVPLLGMIPGNATYQLVGASGNGQMIKQSVHYLDLDY